MAEEKKKNPEMNETHELSTLKTALIPVVLALAAYIQTLQFDFIYDDQKLIVNRVKDYENPEIVGKIFTTPFWGVAPGREKSYYRPLITYTYYLNYQWFGIRPSGYHFFNVVFHTLNVLLIFLVVFVVSKHRIFSFFVSGIFALHPIHTSSVAWVSGRTDVIALTFSLLSVLFFLLSRKNREKFPVLFFSLLSSVSFLLALLSKEVSVAIIFIIPLIDRFFIPRDSSRTLLWKYMEYFWLFFAAGMYLILRYISLEGIMPERISEGIFSEKTLLYFFPEILYYLRVIFFPGRYYIQPQIYLPDSFSDIWFYVFAFVFLSIAVLSVFVKNPLVRLSAGIWFFSVLPVSFINLKNNPVNEYWAYFPSIASCLIVSGLLLRADKLKKLFKFTNSMIAAAFVFTLLFLLCMSRNPVYSNNYSFYTDALEKRQDVPMYYINLAQVYDEKADLKKVEELLYRAVEIDPQTKGAYLNLGTVSVKKGDLESAVKFFKKELELDPDSLTSYISLVKIYMYMDKKEDVVSTAETAFKKFDNSLFVSSELYPVAVDSYSSGKKEIALAILQTILSVTPDFDSAYISIGSIYAHQQDYKNAIFYWQYFLDHFPRNKEAVNVKLWLQDVRDKMKEQNEK